MSRNVILGGLALIAVLLAFKWLATVTLFESVARDVRESQEQARAEAQAAADAAAASALPSVSYADATRSSGSEQNLPAWYQHVIDNAKLTPEEVEAYLSEHGRTVDNLLAASRATGESYVTRIDATSGVQRLGAMPYFEEARALAPNDPRVVLHPIRLGREKDPATIIAALEPLRDAHPDNSLINHHLATAYFRNGEFETAAELLSPSEALATWDGYEQPVEEALGAMFTAAGRDDLTVAWAQATQGYTDSIVAYPLPQPPDSDPTAQDAWARAAYDYGSNLYRPGMSLLDELVATMIQEKASRTLAADEPAWVARAQDYREHQRDLKVQTTELDKLLKSFSPEEALGYLRLVREMGEAEAWRATRDQFADRLSNTSPPSE